VHPIFFKLISLIRIYNDVQLSGMRAVRRIPHHGRSVANPRTRRAANMQYQTPGSTLMVLSPGDRDRDVMDPIAGEIYKNIGYNAGWRSAVL